MYWHLNNFYYQDDDGILHLESKNYIGLDWHPRVKELFFKVNQSILFVYESLHLDSQSYLVIKVSRTFRNTVEIQISSTTVDPGIR